MMTNMKETQNVEVHKCYYDDNVFYYLEPTVKVPDAIYDWIVTRHFTDLDEADAAAWKVCKMIADSKNNNKDWYEAL